MILQDNQLRLPREFGVNTFWDANNPAGNGIIPADGTNLSSIVDLGLNGNTVTQSTGANQIVFKKNVVNNQNAFRFSGSQFASCVNSASNNYVGPLTIITIAMTTQISSIGRVVAKAKASSADGYACGVINSASGATPGASHFTTWFIKDYETTTQQWAVNQYQVMTYRYNANFSVDFYTNRNFIQNVTNATGYSQAIQPLVFGAQSTFLDEPWQGDIIACLIFYRALNAMEIGFMQNYACRRIGV